MRAARDGDVVTLSRHAELVNIRNAGAAALHLAAIEGQLEAARWPLEHGPALDVPDDEFGMTPSAWANEEGREAKLDLFLSQGAVITPFEAAAFAKLDVDLRHRSRQGFTPLEIAERQAKECGLSPAHAARARRHP